MANLKNRLKAEGYPIILTKAQVCEILHLKGTAVYYMTKAGKLRGYRHGNRVVYRRDELAEDIENNILKPV